MNKALAGFASLAALLGSPAAAQELTAQEVAPAIRYALPLMLEGVRNSCAPVLDSSGYLAKNGSRLDAKFSQGSDAYWPDAKQALMAFGGEEMGADAAMFTAMPDEVLQPFVDTMLVQLIAKEIKTDSCADVERGMELLDPLPAENIAEIVGFIVEMDQREKNAKQSQGVRTRK